MASSYISRTPGTAGNRKKWTFSGWYKFNMSAIAQAYWANMFLCGSNGTNYMEAGINNAGFMDWVQSTGGLNARRTTNRKFRDSTGFYHFVFVWDSDNSTAADRMILYVNGVRETSFSATTDPSSSLDSNWNFTYGQFLGSSNGGGPFFNGVMSHVQFVDGLALAPTEFGEFDATDGMWKIKTGSYGTPGAQGFHLKMEDSTNLDLDSSTNAHTFATTGTLISTKDTPSNNLATNNYLMPTIDFTNDSIASIGNRTLMQTSNYKSMYSTLGVSAGKWYAEFKLTTDSGTGSTSFVGVLNGDKYPFFGQDLTDRAIANNANGVAYVRNGGIDYNSGTAVSGQSTYTSGDILQIALDVDNGFIYFGKNNTWQQGDGSNTGVPTSGASGTGGYAITNSTIGTGGTYFMGFGGKSGNSAPYWDINWGNGAFHNANIGTVYADSAGNGAFNYAPPTNFLTICTKNISTNG